MASTANVNQGEGRSKELLQVSHMDGRVPSTWVICCCFSQDINRELDLKGVSQDTNWYPYAMLSAQQATAETAAQQPESL